MTAARSKKKFGENGAGAAFSSAAPGGAAPGARPQPGGGEKSAAPSRLAAAQVWSGRQNFARGTASRPAIRPGCSLRTVAARSRARRLAAPLAAVVTRFSPCLLPPNRSRPLFTAAARSQQRRPLPAVVARSPLCLLIRRRAATVRRCAHARRRRGRPFPATPPVPCCGRSLPAVVTRFSPCLLSPNRGRPLFTAPARFSPRPPVSHRGRPLPPRPPAVGTPRRPAPGGTAGCNVGLKAKRKTGAGPMPRAGRLGQIDWPGPDRTVRARGRVRAPAAKAAGLPTAPAHPPPRLSASPRGVGRAMRTLPALPPGAFWAAAGSQKSPCGGAAVLPATFRA